jgi:Zn-dependent protease
MGWSITAGSVAGTAVRIHVTFLLLLVWIFGVNYFSGGLPAAWGALVFVVLLFLCVLLHEFGHIFTARAFGVSTPDVILLPIGGVSRLERIPEKPSEEFLVAIAGPAVNVVIAVLLILFAGAKLGMDSLVSIENTSAGFIDRLAEVNLFLALFNLIPAFPDGWRACVARAARDAAWLCTSDRDRGGDRSMGCLRARVSRLVRQPVADLHRHLHLSRRLLGGASRGHSRHGAWRAGDSCDVDQVRIAHTG